MIAILSPSKNMVTLPEYNGAVTRPALMDRTLSLAEQLRRLNPWELEHLLRINPKLALEAFARFQDFDPQQPGSPALLCYRGLAYRYLQPETFSEPELAFADKHLRLLSAFYGILHPLDGIQPYRLELQCRVKINGQDLYRFWGDAVYRELFASGETVINLASGEYSKLVLPFCTPRDRVITCDFVVNRKGKLQTIASHAKMARGKMARFLVQTGADSPEALKEFCWNGYRFLPELSTSTRYLFLEEDVR